MYQVPTPIRNEIAKTVKMRNPSMKKLFLMDETEFQTSMENQAALLRKRGLTTNVILLYQKIAPLMMESTAISEYISKTQRLELRTALPEVLTATEAMHVAMCENHLLSLEEQEQLLAQFQKH